MKIVIENIEASDCLGAKKEEARVPINKTEVIEEQIRTLQCISEILMNNPVGNLERIISVSLELRNLLELLDRFSLDVLENIQSKILADLKKENISVKDTLENLSNCKKYILLNMPIEKNLNDKFTW